MTDFLKSKTSDTLLTNYILVETWCRYSRSASLFWRLYWHIKHSLYIVGNYQAKDRDQLDVVVGRCVNILGMLGGSRNHAMVSRSDPSHLAKLAVAWDEQKHLRFDVPFQDLKPTIYFGNCQQVSCFKYIITGRMGNFSQRTKNASTKKWRKNASMLW